MKQVVVSGVFDDLRSGHVRFLEAAATLGDLTVLLWPDSAVQALTGQPPKFPQSERLYFLSAVRYVSRVELVEGPMRPDALPEVAGPPPDVWVVGDCRANAAKESPRPRPAASPTTSWVVWAPKTSPNHFPCRRRLAARRWW